jgi:hypothetical protein
MQSSPEPLTISILLIMAARTSIRTGLSHRYVSVPHDDCGGSSLKEVGYDLFTCDRS